MPGEPARFTFTVTAPPEPATARLGASVRINGARFDNQRVEIRYDHIPPQLLQPAATMKAVSLELAIRGRHVGYLPGAGDEVAASLEQMGYAVTPLTGADLTPDKLRDARRGGHRHPRLQYPEGSRRTPARAVRVRRGRRDGHRAVQPVRRA